MNIGLILSGYVNVKVFLGPWLALLPLFLVACEGVDVKPPPGEGSVFDPRERRDRERFGTVGGGEGIVLFERGGDAATDEAAGGGTLGVNAFIWRGSLETLDFIPLASADPFGGLIITDWYQSVDAPGERVKVHVLIKDQALRADTLKVSVFRQVASQSGWLDAPVDLETARALEDKILSRARELWIQQVDRTS